MVAQGTNAARPGEADRLLGKEEAKTMAERVPLWTLGDKDIKREFQFKDFREAMAFVQGVAGLAERQDHHPDIFISYNRVLLTLSTHKAGGLTAQDFLLATKIDDMVRDSRMRDKGGGP